MKSKIKESKDSMADVEHKQTIRIKCILCGEDITENAKRGAIPFIYGFCSNEHSQMYREEIIENKFTDNDWHWDGEHIILNKELRDMLLRGLL